MAPAAAQATPDGSAHAMGPRAAQATPDGSAHAMAPRAAQAPPDGSAHAMAPTAAGPCWGREHLDEGGHWEDEDWDSAGSLTAREIAALAALDRAGDRASDRDDSLRDAVPMALDPWPAGPRPR